ncbi:AAA family ATPase [Pseudomonas aeruginosa]|jgi:hypothetical protein|uniref:AAA family ATPase n=1 Tax=Pseudomonas aeruginosa TaxID=287 RepID=UPI0021F218E1|nr:AAA family ATPase [Pseudomonas aeruginosa]MCV4385613.1 AAA family ATPase [Pseudomonas aeruginosa]
MKNNIPLELRQLPQWACARADKAPLDPKTGRLADPTDPATWGTFEQAEAYADQYGLRVGFMLSADDPFCVIDLDDKPTKPATEEQKARHQKILEAFQSYTERSSSGTGYHIVVRGAVPSGVHRDNVEVYSDKRFMIFTGDVVRPLPVADYQPMLEVLHAEMNKPQAAPVVDVPPLLQVSDEEVLAKARATYGRRFESLWNGNWQQLGIGDGSQSPADLELAGKLAEFTSDDEQVKRLFLASALGQRDKATKRPDYLDKLTLPKARRIGDSERALMEHGRRVAQVIIAKWEAARKALAANLLEPFAEFIQKKVSVLKLVRGILGEGGLSVLYGAPGAGKSFLALDLGYAVATGQPWMGRDTRQGPVIYAAGEGVSGLRMRGKAIAKVKRCDAPNIFFLPHSLSTPDEGEKMAMVLDQVTARCGVPPALLIIDTLSRFFGEGDDENSAKDMKRFVGAISALMAKCPTLHVMIVHHSGKDADKGMRGSSALQGAADTVIQCRKDGDAHRAVVEKQKDGQDNIPLPFALDQVELGEDEDGEPITSCVVVHDHDGKARPLTGWTATAVKVLRQLMQSGMATGGNLATEIPLIAYHNHWYQERPADKKDTVRKNARRQLETLREKKLLEWNGGESPIRLLPTFNGVTIELE